jgi:hypothetical protein
MDCQPNKTTLNKFGKRLQDKRISYYLNNHPKICPNWAMIQLYLIATLDGNQLTERRNRSLFKLVVEEFRRLGRIDWFDGEREKFDRIKQSLMFGKFTKAI